MQRNGKTVRVASDTTVISEGYDLILSHCITRGLNYIIWHTHTHTHTAWKLQCAVKWIVLLCVCYGVTAYPFRLRQWCRSISTKKQPWFHLLPSSSHSLFHYDHMTTRSHDRKVTWLTGSQHSTSRQHLEKTTWPQVSLEDTSLRTLEEYHSLSLCVKVYPCMSAKKAYSSALLWHLLLTYPCSVYEIIPTPIRQI